PTDTIEPEINYLAKDYASFRQLLLDRLAVVMPDWQERHVPDLGIMLVELLAYAGDYLSYYQDAVATEAYLGTARQRISVRRHARLVDYTMHEGCNARTWLHIKTDSNSQLDPQKVTFVTGLNGVLPENGRILTWDMLKEMPPAKFEQFKPFTPNDNQPIDLYAAHNVIYFYSWGDADCYLQKGATSATLLDTTKALCNDQPVKPAKKKPAKKADTRRILNLQKDDMLLFEEIVSPQTGSEYDANPARRHVVRLNRNPVWNYDPLYDNPVLEISWDVADALPFSLCLSAIGPAPACKRIDPVSVARGNMLLVDHGQWVSAPQDGKPLWCVPLADSIATCDGAERPSDITLQSGPFSPRLEKSDLTHREPYPYQQPATQMLRQDVRQALPLIQLNSHLSVECGAAPEVELEQIEWQIRRDLLASLPTDPHFVAEIDNEGRAHLRFGKNDLGQQPPAQHRFTAVYRIGNGSSGNVGAESITHAVSDTLIDGVTWRPYNPFPAVGGIDAEPMAEVKLYAPHTFRRRLERAITPDDYANIVMRDFSERVQRAAATFLWTGSWTEVLVAVDPLSSVTAVPQLLADITQHLTIYRRIGHDVVVKLAQYVSLDLAFTICVKPNYLRGHVKAELMQVFSNRLLRNGRKGVFHPDNLTFGEGVRQSQLVAIAQAVPGVLSVRVTKFQRQFEPLLNNKLVEKEDSNDEEPANNNGDQEQKENPATKQPVNLKNDEGIIELSALEIARVDNDPNFPEHGCIQFTMEGGR
ncbi:MAG: putative baseplate assembly protein, partial [Chloroflexi bacterium]